jgi:hypothetical protein
MGVCAVFSSVSGHSASGSALPAPVAPALFVRGNTLKFTYEFPFKFYSLGEKKQGK